MQNYYDVVQTASGSPIAGASVFVYAANGSLATIYSDNGFTITTNPLTTGADGKFLFYAANGLYSAVITCPSYDNKTISNITLADPAPAEGTVNIQEFAVAGTSTWTKPTGARLVHVVMYGGGGGGGGGRRRSASTVNSASGGSGGATGSRMELWIPAATLGSTESVTVAAGGSAGAAATVDETDGGAGGAGGVSSFGTSTVWIRARGGNGGGAGNSAGGVTGGALASNLAENISAFNNFYAGTGGASTATAPGTGVNGNSGGYKSGGGAGGGSVTAGTSTASAGGVGGSGGNFFAATSSASGNGGAAGTTAGTNGDPGAASASYYVGGSGGGGGGCGTAAAGNGGNGGAPGGGGGGGGAAMGAFNSGAGGTGGAGFVRITTFL